MPTTAIYFRTTLKRKAEQVVSRINWTKSFKDDPISPDQIYDASFHLELVIINETDHGFSCPKHIYLIFNKPYFFHNTLGTK